MSKYMNVLITYSPGIASITPPRRVVIPRVSNGTEIAAACASL